MAIGKGFKKPATAAKQDEKPQSKAPVEVFRAGCAKVAIWENESKDGTVFHNTTVAKVYMDASKKWQETNQFNVRDLPKLILAAQKAYEFVMLSQQNEDKEAAEED